MSRITEQAGSTTNLVQTMYNDYPRNTKGGQLEWLKSGTPSAQPVDRNS